MSVLDLFDATTLCSRTPLADPSAWARPIANPARPETPVARAASSGFSWRSWARNPQALLLTGVITAGLLRDAVTGARAS